MQYLPSEFEVPSEFDEVDPASNYAVIEETNNEIAKNNEEIKNIDDMYNTIEKILTNSEKYKEEINALSGNIQNVNNDKTNLLDLKTIIEEIDGKFGGSNGKKVVYKKTNKKYGNRCIYENKNKTKYIRINGKYELLSKYRKQKEKKNV